MSRSCNDCLKYKILTVEYDESTHSPKMKFHTYEVFTIFSKHRTIGPGNLLCHVYSKSILCYNQNNCESIKKKYSKVERVINRGVYEVILHTCVGKLFVSYLLFTYTF